MTHKEFYMYAKNELFNAQDKNKLINFKTTQVLPGVASKFLETTTITHPVAIDYARCLLAISDERKSEADLILEKYEGNFAKLFEEFPAALYSQLKQGMEEIYARSLSLHWAWRSMGFWTDHHQVALAQLDDIFTLLQKNDPHGELSYGAVGIMWAYLAAGDGEFEHFYQQRHGIPFSSIPSPAQNAQQQQSNLGKSKILAGLLGIFLGSLGIHNFYLGHKKKAIVQLILGTVGWFFYGGVISGIWGLVEGIRILIGATKTDASGNPLT